MKNFVSVIFDNDEINETLIVESMKSSAGMALTESETVYGLFETVDNKIALQLRISRELSESESDLFAKKLASKLFDQGYNNFDIEVSVNESVELLEANGTLNLNDYKQQIEAAGPYTVNAAGTQVTTPNGTVAGVNQNGNLWSGSQVITQIVRRGITDANRPTGPGASRPAPRPSPASGADDTATGVPTPPDIDVRTLDGEYLVSWDELTPEQRAEYDRTGAVNWRGEDGTAARLSQNDIEGAPRPAVDVAAGAQAAINRASSPLAQFAQSGEGGIRNNPEARDAIRELQNKLNELGFDAGTADGIYGRRTRAAVRAYQEANGLTADGDAGPETIASILGQQTQPAPSTPAGDSAADVAADDGARQGDEEPEAGEDTDDFASSPEWEDPGNITFSARGVNGEALSLTYNPERNTLRMQGEDYDRAFNGIAIRDGEIVAGDYGFPVPPLAERLPFGAHLQDTMMQELGDVLSQDQDTEEPETPAEPETPEEPQDETAEQSGADTVETADGPANYTWTITKEGDTISGTASGPLDFDFTVEQRGGDIYLNTSISDEPTLFNPDLMPNLYAAIQSALNESVYVKNNPLLEQFYSEEETYNGNDFFEAYGVMWFNEDDGLDEAEYQGRKVKLGKPMRGDVKKFKVYVRNPKGNIVKVNFGDPDMRIKKSNPARRRSFRARHNCDNPGPRHKARYWSCRKW